MLRTRFLFDVFFPTLMLCWAAVLIYSAIASDTGYRALASVNRDVDTLSAEVDALRARRMALEKRADLLNPKSLDPDLIDERIRGVLGYSREGDVVAPMRELELLLDEPPAKTK